MNRQNSLLIILLAVSVVGILGYRGFGWENNFKDKEIVRVIDSFVTPETPSSEAWQVFESYLVFLRTHNLAGVRSLSHQTSTACSDPTEGEACLALMDNVYEIASPFKQSDFKHIQADERQIIMFTDGPVVAMLYFTRDSSGVPKVLGLKFCLEDETGLESCVETDPSRRDLDNNGWWDSVESLFYN
ncbi:MAG: hypothetical protein WD897_01670 [Parcubacteria group bacterium]